MLKQVIASLTTVALLSNGTMASAEQLTPKVVTTSSLAPASYATIKNSYNSDTRMLICKNWGVGRCATNSPQGYLNGNENSRTKFGWHDTDGISWIPYGYVLKNTSGVIVAYGGRPFKVNGFFGKTFTYSLERR